MPNPMPAIHHGPRPIYEAAAIADARNGMKATALKIKYGIGWKRACDLVDRASEAVAGEIAAGFTHRDAFQPFALDPADGPDGPDGADDAGSLNAIDPPPVTPDWMEPTDDPEDTSLWDIALKVNEADADAVLASFTREEIVSTFSIGDKMECISAVLQLRLDRSIAHPSVPSTPAPEGA